VGDFSRPSKSDPTAAVSGAGNSTGSDQYLLAPEDAGASVLWPEEPKKVRESLYLSNAGFTARRSKIA
jgi:hypothetical protein